MTWDPSADRSETEGERIDRNWNELLQELRVAQTGVQIFAGFLLVLPFQPAFASLSAWERHWYLATLSVALASTLFVLSPVVAHRRVFRRHAKDRLLRVADRLAQIGLWLLGVTLISALGLVTGVVLGRLAAGLAIGVGVVLLAALWLVVPRMLLRHDDGGSYDDRLPAATDGS